MFSLPLTVFISGRMTKVHDLFHIVQSSVCRSLSLSCRGGFQESKFLRWFTEINRGGCDVYEQLADECFDLLDRTFVERSRTVKPNADGSIEYSFLEQIITPVYNVVAAVKCSYFSKMDFMFLLVFLWYLRLSTDNWVDLQRCVVVRIVL